ncbi:MAG: YegS/Rv2252/BmrU family lipid kinase [Clostridia bacterium]|nr:YegS/Rv2252/BmrU family lipid kinase [Clostridia bacterium]
MKTIFIVNPCAGHGNKAQILIDKINRMCGADKEIYLTKAVGDATRYIKEYIKDYGPARFIACGGDGTFNEVLNGVEFCSEAEIGVIPIGTGNDFCRNFESSFDDIAGQTDGIIVKCDAIRYTTETDKGTITGFCANMFNIGFDCNVADMTARMKKKPLISGSMAYFVSILANLIGKKGANLEIEIDNTVKHRGRLLLTSIANGCYCGGGIKSNPLASICDGTININIIKNVSRLKFLRLLPSYMKGTFLNIKNIDDIILSANCRKIVITPLEGKMRLCIDGEIIDAGKTQFEICPGAFNFVIPRGLNSKCQKESTKAFSGNNVG